MPDTPNDVAALLAVVSDPEAQLFDRVEALRALVGSDDGPGSSAVPLSQEVVAAIRRIAENEEEQEYLCRTAGECLGHLWCRARTYDGKAVKRLTYDARKALWKVIGEHRPELIPDTAKRRVCREHLRRLAAVQVGMLTERPDEDRMTLVGDVEGHPFRLKVKIESGEITLRVKLQRSPGELLLTYEPGLDDDAAGDGAGEPEWQKQRPSHRLSSTVTLEQPDDTALALIAALPEELRAEVAHVMDDCGVSELRLRQDLHFEFLVDVHSYDDPDEPLEPDEEAYDITTSVAPALSMAGRLANALETMAPPRSLDETVRCPYCGATAYLTPDLKCPNCGAAVL